MSLSKYGFTSKTAAASRHARNLILAAIAGVTLGVVPIGFGPGAVLGPASAQAQNFSQRTIQGKVLDDREASVAGATVFLKNLKTRNVKSFTSTGDGTFRFAQVGMIDDYEVWAEHDKHKSPTKTVSSFDSRKQLDFDLKLK